MSCGSQEDQTDLRLEVDWKNTLLQLSELRHREVAEAELGVDKTLAAAHQLADS